MVLQSLMMSWYPSLKLGRLLYHNNGRNKAGYDQNETSRKKTGPEIKKGKINETSHLSSSSSRNCENIILSSWEIYCSYWVELASNFSTTTILTYSSRDFLWAEVQVWMTNVDHLLTLRVLCTLLMANHSVITLQTCSSLSECFYRLPKAAKHIQWLWILKRVLFLNIAVLFNLW